MNVEDNEQLRRAALVDEWVAWIKEERPRLMTENRRFREALERVQANAESWHGDDAAKGRALTVIAGWARAALSEAGGQE